MAIKVYVVDDSAVVRQTLMHLLQGDPEIELMGSAPNPLIAGPVIRKNRPDVLLLDIVMPGMDGLTFLRQVMEASPIPTVICSTLTTDGSRMALEALAHDGVPVLLADVGGTAYRRVRWTVGPDAPQVSAVAV